MTDEIKEKELAQLEAQLREERRKIKKYQLLMEGAIERKKEIEEKIKNKK